MTRGFIDLHCHFVADIDDGARDAAEGVRMLRALAELGFEHVIATPHMRLGLFDNSKRDIESAYAAMLAVCEPLAGELPQTGLASEHYFDDVVFARILAGEALPYPGGKAVLLEFYAVDYPPALTRCFAQLRLAGLLPVIAHPERYQCSWRGLSQLEQLVENGAAALLDTASLSGKYGSQPRRAAEAILEAGLYHAACSDAHRPDDALAVAAGMRRIEKLYGAEELELLFREGPRALLAGKLPG